MAKISVIVAVYNVESYIERCARSLFEQTLDDLEYIFVDDCSPDRSMEVLDRVLSDYPHRRAQVKLIRHEQNRGVGATRADGMHAATGEYSIHCDPDDWVNPDAYERLYQAAVNADADIASGRAIVHLPNNTQYLFGNVFNGKARDVITSPNGRSNLWLQIIRTDIFNRFEIFPWEEVSFGEDTSTVLRAYAKADKIVGTDLVFYHYDRTREGTLTNASFENKAVAIDLICAKLEEWFLKNTDLTLPEINSIFNNYKRGIKFELLEKDTRDVAAWYRYWPENINFEISHMSGVSRMIFRLGKYFHFLPVAYLRYIDWRTCAR